MPVAIDVRDPDVDALNAAGDVVGAADLPGSQGQHAFLWQHGVMTDLGFP